jgi:CO/xanthine dehydrogenase Mo-binding subunit
VGSADIGQGSDTVLAQIAAQELGVALEDVAIASRDTDSTPYNWATTASRLTYTAGNAVRRAAEDAKKKLLALAAGVLEVEAEDLTVEDRSVVAVDGSGKRLPLADVGAISLWVTHGPIIGAYSWMYEGNPWGADVTLEGWPFHGMGAWIYGAQGVEVDVDLKTGQVVVVKAVIAQDVGRAINPISVEGQCQGGFVQGLGAGLFEEIKLSDGHILNTNLVDYKIPTALDVPSIESLIVESFEPTGPFGAKGVGEAPIVPTAPAIANAVADATGVRIYDLPLSAERVLAALDALLED